MTTPNISFEFYPARDGSPADTPVVAATKLAVFKPSFMAVTCHTAGAHSARTLLTAKAIQTATRTPTAAHLTCIGASRAAVTETANQLWHAGIKQVVALRGDVPKDGVPSDGDFSCARELTANLRTLHAFKIYTAGYPETHPDARGDWWHEIDYLRQKVDAGADSILTQACFDTNALLRYRDRVVRAGIKAAVIPGIMPIISFPRATALCSEWGVTMPATIAKIFEPTTGNTEAQRSASRDVALEQCDSLLAEGYDHLHFYTHNRPGLVEDVCRWLRADSLTA